MDESSNNADNSPTSIAPSVLPINPQLSPAPSIGQAPVPTPKKKLPIKYLAIGIVAILVMAVGASTFLKPSRTLTTSSSSSSSSVQTTYSTVTSTIPSIINSTCPCFTEQQLAQLLNVSTNAKKSAVFNVTFAPNNTAVMAIKTRQLVPSGLLTNVTEAWVIFYNTSAFSPLSSAAEEVLKSSNISWFVSHLNYEVNYSNHSVRLRTINGFHYLSQQSNLSGANSTIFVGYKDDYIITFLMYVATNKTVASANEIASEISNSTP